MSPWDTYEKRADVSGRTKHDTYLRREKHMLTKKVPENLSWQIATIYDAEHGYNITQYDGAETDGIVRQEVAIVNSDNLNEKYIYSLPDEDIDQGALIHWMGNYWLVTERDANTTVYTRAKLLQCNYLLRWVGRDKEIYEQWCVIEDGTKYLTGEYEDRHFVVTRGDSRLAMTIAKNSKTAKFGRKNRFLIDDEASEPMLAYALTKPFKLGGSFNGKGVYKFVLQEVNTTDDDNQRLRIADYFKFFPRDTAIDPGLPPLISPDRPTDGTGRRNWL